jgi:glucarate dehydratase
MKQKKLLIGKDVFQLNQIRTVLTERFGSESPLARGEAPWDQRKLVHIFSSVEVACMDIMGKVLGRPIVDLLGGKMRESVPFSAYLFYKYEGAGGEFGFGLNPNAAGMGGSKTKGRL